MCHLEQELSVTAFDYIVIEVDINSKMNFKTALRLDILMYRNS